MAPEAVVESRNYPHKLEYAKRLIKKRRFRRKIIDKSQAIRADDHPIALQKLYDACKHVFKGPGTVPFPLDVNRLCDIIDKMKPEDVGLSSQLQFFKPKPVVNGTPRVTTTTIYKCDEFSLCMFFLPANAVIPLHNHPGMTVFSKLLLGTMHIKSYDLVTPPDEDELSQPSNVKLARLVVDNVFEAPCTTSVLYPTTGGNIHQFTAITPCAVLDVLGPPYSMEDGRDGSYYKDYPYDSFSNVETKLVKEGEKYGWLEEIEMPENSEMNGIEYLGPQIVENNDC